MQVEAAGGNNALNQQEDAGDNEVSILENLSPLSGDASSMDSEEYNRLMKEMEEKEKAEVESAPPKQVLATVRGLDEDSDSEKTPPNAAVPGSSNQGSDLGFGEGISLEELTRIGGKNCRRGEQIHAIGWLKLGPDVRKGIRRRGRLREKVVELKGQAQHDVCIKR
jgi:hypothetical protein